MARAGTGGPAAEHPPATTAASSPPAAAMPLTVLLAVFLAVPLTVPRMGPSSDKSVLLVIPRVPGPRLGAA